MLSCSSLKHRHFADHGHRLHVAAFDAIAKCLWPKITAEYGRLRSLGRKLKQHGKLFQMGNVATTECPTCHGKGTITVKKNGGPAAAIGGAMLGGAMFGLTGVIIGGLGGAMSAKDIDVQEKCSRCHGQGRVELGNRSNTQSSVESSGTPRGWHQRGGKTMKMYHGTNAANAQSIMENGFNASSGGMLGQGVYLSADIEKAKRYGSSILVVEAKLGKTKKIDSQSHPMRESWNSHGYDSA